MVEVLEVGEMADLIVRDIKHAETAVVLESRDFGQDIVGDVEFLEIGEAG